LGAWEISVRAERLLASYGAADLTPGGAWGWAASLHVWEKRWVAVALTGFVQRYDRAAVEAPDVTTSWSLLARATVVVP
jgi:hypothetical protein